MTPRDPVRERIETTLLRHRLQYVEDADQEGNGYPLLDALSMGSEEVAPGRLEIELLADAIASDLEGSRPYVPHPGEHPDTRRGSARDPQRDRDKVRELAEEIVAHGANPRSGGHEDHEYIRENNVRSWEDRLRAFLAEREEKRAPWAPTEAALIIDALLATNRPDRELRSRAEEFSASCRRVRPASPDEERDAQLHRALGELAGLREKLEVLVEYRMGDAPCGNEEISDFVEQAIASSPLAKLAGDLLRESLRHAEANRLCEEGGFDDSEYDLDDVSGVRFRAAADALRAELAREGGEGG